MDTPQPGSWHPRSVAIGVGLVFVLQVVLIFWLGDTKPIYPRRPSPAPVLQLAGNCNAEFLTLSDPTLFALPHQEGFSGLAWLTNHVDHHPSEQERSWSEDSHWLPLSMQQLGGAFLRIAPAHFTLSLDTATLPEPEPFSARFDSRPLLPAKSSVRIEGALAQWRLLRPIELRSWQARRTSATDTDLLTNTVVQLMVDGRGEPVSATLLSSSGLAEADSFALDQARVCRFEPPNGAHPDAAFGANPLLHLRWGRLVFDWHTVPITNVSAGAPPSP